MLAPPVAQGEPPEVGAGSASALVVRVGATTGSVLLRALENLRGVPLLLGAEAAIATAGAVYDANASRSQASPRVVVVAVDGAGGSRRSRLRVGVRRALSPLLRATGGAPWARKGGRVMLVTHLSPSPSDAADANRALARLGAWTATAVALGRQRGAPEAADTDAGDAGMVLSPSLSDTTKALSEPSLSHCSAALAGSPDAAVVILFSPARRPARQPCAIALSRFRTASIPRWPDASGQSLVFAVMTNSLEEEAACLNGFSPLWDDPLVQTAITFASRLRVRPLCFSEAWTYHGALRADGSFSGLMAAVARGRADMLLHEPQAFAEWARHASLLFPHHVDALCVYVRRAPPTPFFQSLLNAYQ